MKKRKIKIKTLENYITLQLIYKKKKSTMFVELIKLSGITKIL